MEPRLPLPGSTRESVYCVSLAPGKEQSSKSRAHVLLNVYPFHIIEKPPNPKSQTILSCGLYLFHMTSCPPWEGFTFRGFRVVTPRNNAVILEKHHWETTNFGNDMVYKLLLIPKMMLLTLTRILTGSLNGREWGVIVHNIFSPIGRETIVPRYKCIILGIWTSLSSVIFWSGGKSAIFWLLFHKL